MGSKKIFFSLEKDCYRDVNVKNENNRIERCQYNTKNVRDIYIACQPQYKDPQK